MTRKKGRGKGKGLLSALYIIMAMNMAMVAAQSRNHVGPRMETEVGP